MARFRRAGENWEGRTWRVTPSLGTLLDEVETAYVERRSLDGTVASKVHDAENPNSDHRPRPYSGFGWVRAADIGELEPEGDFIAEALRRSRDPRIKYVIHERRLFSSYDHSAGPAFTWRPYSGYNAHLTHVHVSVWGDDWDVSPWNLGLGEEILAGLQIVDLQKALNQANQLGPSGQPLVEDGIYGPNTAFALANGFRALEAGPSIEEVIALIESATLNVPSD